jgi:two-component system OmpR family sensor kinase
VSIKWRLTLSFSSVFAIAAIIGALFFFAAFRNWMIAERIDGNLKVYSTALLVLASTSDNVDLLTDSSDIYPTSEIWVQLTDSNGAILAKSDNLGERTLPIVSGEDGPVTRTLEDGTSIRILSVPLPAEDQTYQLEFAQSLAAIDPSVTSMGIALLLTIVVFLTLVTVAAAILVGRALSPVKKVTATAQDIASSSDLSRRVNYQGPKDEVGELAATFDRMIEQLDRLLQSQRTFVADASHELRGPLTVIRGNLDLLKRNLSEEDRAESTRVLEAEMARMTRIVNDLLVLAEVESGPLEQQQTVSLKDILLDAQDRALLLAGNRKIAIGRQEDLWVKGDGHKLDQMVNNLVTNAVKYTPDGGTITLSLHQDGDWACLEVADTGIGISPEHLPHIFDRFYRVDKAHSRAGGGTGLGLAIVKGIAQQHGGTVTVTSEPGKGSTFSVRLKH